MQEVDVEERRSSEARSEIINKGILLIPPRNYPEMKDNTPSFSPSPSFLPMKDLLTRPSCLNCMPIER